MEDGPENYTSAVYSRGDIKAGEALFRRPWDFVTSIPSLELLPPADRPEIALAGRSNVGKSSLINAVVRHHGLARTSNTPGRTQLLNFFAAPDVKLSLVDMPGYGYAEAPKAMVDNWTRLVRDYLAGRRTLVRLMLLIDARHGIKSNDDEIMDMLDTAAVSYQVVLTKADKIKDKALEALLAETSVKLAKHPASFPRIVATSSETGHGLADLRAEIAIAAGFRG